MSMDDRELLWALIERDYLFSDSESLQRSIAHHLEFSQAKTRYTAQLLDIYRSVAFAVRDRLIEKWNDTNRTYFDDNVKKVYYLSLEFLMGRALDNSLINLGIRDEMEKALAGIGMDFETLEELETDAGLGNGGLGRLAACFLDSMATLQIPGEGYGIRYEYGIFRQEIIDGQQVEQPDHWLRYGYPFEVVRPEYQYKVNFGGRVSNYVDSAGRLGFAWTDTVKVVAMPYDILIPGYRNETVNTLRLWSAKAVEEFELHEFNRGDYIGAMHERITTETISSVLYPRDDTPAGKELRLKQQYFFVSATIQDILRRHRVKNPDVLNLPEKVAIQLNDTHPALAIVELMRILLDTEHLDWSHAWDITTRTCAYTNHTMLPEALEVWPIDLVETLLPRHVQIIYEINYRFLGEVSERYPNDNERLRRMSIIQEGPYRGIRMANLSIIGSHAVNGVSRLHTDLLKSQLFRDFHEFWPDKLSAKTNGVTQRRWLKQANPHLSRLISDSIGQKWITDLTEMQELLSYAEDTSFQDKWSTIKQGNKIDFSNELHQRYGILLDPDSMFDVHVKRIHEYKRQLLNVLHILTLYRQLKAQPDLEMVPRTFLFGGKAAPGYHMAKLIIKLINDVAALINNDSQINGRLRVFYLPNFSVSLAQRVYPAADLSEQISTAGMEASGTGNMKFMLNGALTIGTLDGANVEMLEEVGSENIFIFGLTAAEVQNLLSKNYNPEYVIRPDPELRAVLAMLINGELNKVQPELYRPIFDAMVNRGDRYMVLADYQPYIECHRLVERLYRDREAWTRKSIIQTAKVGKFSSDRAINEYARDIWHISPVRPRKSKP